MHAFTHVTLTGGQSSCARNPAICAPGIPDAITRSGVDQSTRGSSSSHEGYSPLTFLADPGNHFCDLITIIKSQFTLIKLPKESITTRRVESLFSITHKYHVIYLIILMIIIAMEMVWWMRLTVAETKQTS